MAMQEISSDATPTWETSRTSAIRVAFMLRTQGCCVHQEVCQVLSAIHSASDSSAPYPGRHQIGDCGVTVHGHKQVGLRQQHSKDMDEPIDSA